jgi:predicted nucleic acid-binding protein
LTGVIVDSSVLLDVIGADTPWSGWSSTALAAIGDEATLVINQLIYAEVSVRFETIEAVEEALSPSIFRREEIPYEAAFLAAKVFAQYRQRGGARSSPLPDFFIGAHAAIAGYRVVTRDPQRLRAYFPRVDLIAPS